MRLSLRPVHHPCWLSSSKNPTFCSCTVTDVQPTRSTTSSLQIQTEKTLERFLHPLERQSSGYAAAAVKPLARLGKRWMEYQGISNWDGLLDPLDDNLRCEILRYGNFVEAAYKACDFDPASPTYASRRFSKTSLFERCGLPRTGYRITKNLRATSGIELPGWLERAPSWVVAKSSWIGYVAVCQDKEEIARLGRRDIVIALRGTATCLEWLENLRANLTVLPSMDGDNTSNVKVGEDGSGGSLPMVESGFLSLYTSRSPTLPSLQEMVREEIARLVEMYQDEPLSLTITGHSLGAALATLTAYDIQKNIQHAPLVTVVSFGGPRVGDRTFRSQLERQGTRVLRIVNSDDVITKVPGFTIDDRDDVATKQDILGGDLPGWIRKCVADTQWVYAEVGEELRLCSRNSPYLKGIDVATCHDLKTYLHLVSGFVSSKCPFRATAKTFLAHHFRTERVGAR